jgi:glycosyltransferase involved in cell wall biosynthesis
MSLAVLADTRLLVIAPPFQPLPPTGYGGIERVVLERTRVLSAFGATVDVVCPAGSQISHARKSIECGRVKLSDIPSTGSRVLDSIRYLIKSDSLRYMKTYLAVKDIDEYDCVFNDAFRSEPWIALSMQRKFGWYRTINMLHANAPIWTGSRPYGKLHTFRFGALNSRTQAYLANHGWRTNLLPNGINCPPENQVVVDPEAYLIHITRISEAKGTDQAIRIAQVMGLPLRIYGKIQDDHYFNRAVRPHLRKGTVDYFGQVSRPELDDATRHATALVFTSTYSDPHPAVLLEALRFGTPIVALNPGPFSGFYDVCNSLNSVSGDSHDEIRAKLERVTTFSRLEVARDIRRRFSWESVIQSCYVPLVRGFTHGT